MHKEKLFQILDDLYEPVAVVDQRGVIIYYNKNFLTFSKAKPRELETEKCYDELIACGEFNIRQQLANVQEQGETIRSGEVQLQQMRGGENFHGVLRLIPLSKWLDGQLVLISFQDFSAEKRLQDKYRAQLDELKQNHHSLMQSNKLQALGEIYANIAHEISNPLMAALLQREKIERILNRDEEINVNDINELLLKLKIHMETISTFVGNMKRYVGNNTKKYVDLKKVVQDAVDLIIPLFLEKDVEVGFNLANERIICWGNDIELQQMLVNLCKNALDAICEKQTDNGKIGIDLKENPEDKTFQLKISDNGRGMSPEEISNIFTPFYSTKSADKGTGLGLAIVKKIATEHDIEMEVNSSVGKGTEFLLSLPTLEVTNFTKGLQHLTDQINKILIVSKDVEILNHISEALNDVHYVTLGCDNILAAEQLLGEMAFALLVIDENLSNDLKWPQVQRWVVSGASKQMSKDDILAAIKRCLK